jgi:hypothetical protein
MATFNDSSKEKKTKWHANREANIYILFTMEQQQEEKKRNKQETDYNKILVGAHIRDRKRHTREEMIINSRLNGSNLIFCFVYLISKYTIQPLLCMTHRD